MGEYYWTRHSEFKMKQYALSEQRVRRVIRHPDRVEKSIVPGMVAVMQIAGTSKNRQEIWVMYEIKGKVKSEKGKGEEGEEKTSNLKSQISNIRSSSNFQLLNSKFQTMSPAQKFRLQRQQEFLAKKSGGGEGGKILRIISVWRYPGTSPERDPIPEDILDEIRDMMR